MGEDAPNHCRAEIERLNKRLEAAEDALEYPNEQTKKYWQQLKSTNQK